MVPCIGGSTCSVRSWSGFYLTTFHERLGSSNDQTPLPPPFPCPIKGWPVGAVDTEQEPLIRLREAQQSSEGKHGHALIPQCTTAIA